MSKTKVGYYIWTGTTFGSKLYSATKFTYPENMNIDQMSYGMLKLSGDTDMSPMLINVIGHDEFINDAGCVSNGEKEAIDTLNGRG